MNFGDLIERDENRILFIGEMMENSWPPMMRIGSEDLKRCLGDREMVNETMWKRLNELGYNSETKYIITEDLIDRVIRKDRNKSIIGNFKDYKGKSEASQKI